MSNASWTAISPSSQAFLDKLEVVNELLDPVLTALDTVVNILDAAAQFVLAVDSAISRALNEIKTALLGLIQDILDANMSMCVHHNVQWDDDWSWAPKKMQATVESTGQTRRNRNYREDGDLPWKASGLNGWLDDILMSSLNGENASAPRTDNDDKLLSFILIFGFPDVDAFLDMPDKLKEFLKGLNLRFVDKSWETYQSSYGRGVTRLKDGVFSDDIEFKLEPFSQNTTGLEPNSESTGDFPYWISVSLGKILGPSSDNIFKVIENFIGALEDFSDTSAIVMLIEGLALKVQSLQKIISELDRAIEAITSVIEAITELGQYVVITSDSGMQGVIQGAKQADNFPELGNGAAIAGLCCVGSSAGQGDNIIEKFDKLLEIFGLKTSDEGNTFVNNINAASSEFNVQTSSGSFTIS